MAGMRAPVGAPSSAAIIMAIAGVYVGQSVIAGLTIIGLPAVLRDAGASLERIGLLYITVLPWSLKFLWAPAVDRFRLPAVGGDRSNLVVLVGNALCALGLAIAGLLGESLLSQVACLSFVAFVAATTDIACDGYAVEHLPRRHHGWGNAAQVGSSYLGSAIGAGLFLVLVAQLGWRSACFAMAALVLVLSLPFSLGLGRGNAVGTRSHRPMLLVAFARPEMRDAIVATALFVAAQKWGLAMLGPFLVDQGFSLSMIGVLNGAGSVVLGLSGAVSGGACVRYLGPAKVLAISLLAQAVLLACLAAIALGMDAPLQVIVSVALMASSGVMSFGFVALYSQFMRLADPRQAGVDFTILQCTDGIVTMVGGVAVGWLAERLGYGAIFGAASGVALASILIIFRLFGRIGMREPLTPK
ncbi:AmpG permease [plant metagenome]|uniref:AmpG permease n=1 Tax=plant metagenome TaxID=1297885 RepID=A0A484SIC1_9ZZZZ